ncbi:MAG: hypothetical protein JEZ11_09210 [Desulfobacterales bacterium]|nr:hypothetical protein [Desulfobacterales bacterium]
MKKRARATVIDDFIHAVGLESAQFRGGLATVEWGFGHGVLFSAWVLRN